MIVYSGITLPQRLRQRRNPRLPLGENPPREMNAFVNEQERSVSTTSTDARCTR